jgi:hypothetical protein
MYMYITLIVIVIVLLRTILSTTACQEAMKHGVEPQEDTDILRTKIIYYIYGYSYAHLKPSGAISILKALEVRTLERPFKIIEDPAMKILKIVDLLTSKKEYRKESDVEFVKAEIVRQPMENYNISKCDGKIPKSRAIVKNLPSREEVSYFLHACRVFALESGAYSLENIEILWNGAKQNSNRSRSDQARFLVPNEYVDDRVICTCGKLPYYLSNCSDPESMKFYAVKKVDGEFLIMTCGFIFFGVSLVGALIFGVTAWVRKCMGR